MLLGQAPPRKGIPCTTCAAYRTMKREGKWLKRGFSRQMFLQARKVYRRLKLYRVQHAMRKRLPV